MKSARIRLALFAIVAAVLLALSVRAAQAAGRYFFNAEAGYALAAQSYPGPDDTPTPQGTDPSYPGPGPSATPTNTSTQPPSPTNTSTLPPNPTNTATQPPSATPTQTQTQLPSPSAETPAPQEPSPTLEPTNTQEPDLTQEPTGTQEPSPTQDATVGPTATAEPSHTPVPTQGRIELHGQITAIDGETWTIAGYQVCVVAGATQVQGNPGVGDVVSVKAEWQPDGTLLALKVVKEQEATREPTEKKVSFSGEVAATNGDQWTIDNRTVLVTGATKIKGDPAVGDTVKVQARQKTDGSLVAESITVTKVKQKDPSDHNPDKKPDRDKDKDHRWDNNRKGRFHGRGGR